MRTVEYFDIDIQEWSDIEWSSIVSGTTIKIKEVDGTPVVDGTGVYELVTESDAYLQTISGIGDIWTVNVLDPAPYTAPKFSE